MSEQYKEGDLVTITITGCVVRARGDAIVITAHGVEVPVLASQVNTPTLAQKILEMILQAENELERTKIFYTDVNRFINGMSLLTQLATSIKELCQEELNKQ